MHTSIHRHDGPWRVGRSLVIAACLLVGLAGCETFGIHRSAIPAGQEILFEVEYMNFAWVPTWTGVYVDAEGSVWAYDRSGEPWQTDRPDAYTRDELMDKYGSETQLLTRVHHSELENAARRIDPASSGKVVRGESMGNDMGVVIFRAYRFDRGSNLYHPIVLHQRGDIGRTNTSRDAQLLVAWLEGILDNADNMPTWLPPTAHSH